MTVHFKRAGGVTSIAPRPYEGTALARGLRFRPKTFEKPSLKKSKKRFEKSVLRRTGGRTVRSRQFALSDWPSRLSSIPGAHFAVDPYTPTKKIKIFFFFSLSIYLNPTCLVRLA